MTSATLQPDRKAPAISNGTFGMALFVAVEILFFAGLLSAYVVTRQSLVSWPPPDQPHLPIPLTVFNTILLFISGFLMFKANKLRKSSDLATGQFYKLFGVSILFGSLFLVFQGYEWIRLIGHGLTLHSSIYGSLFYVIVGAHALHALGALLFMIALLIRLRTQKALNQDLFDASQLFWYFVVGVWPIIFVMLYVLQEIHIWGISPRTCSRSSICFCMFCLFFCKEGHFSCLSWNDYFPDRLTLYGNRCGSLVDPEAASEKLVTPHPPRAMNTILNRLIEKHQGNVPRYTSYPTPDRWTNTAGLTNYGATLRTLYQSDESISLYIHIPFCQKLCYYCACNTMIRSKKQAPTDDYLDHLEMELKQVADMAMGPLSVSQLHLGGGTPTFLSPVQIQRLLQICHQNFRIDESSECSFETDPSTCTKEQIQLLYDQGFRRISFGVQDFDPEVLQAVNRDNSPEQISDLVS